MRDLAIEMTKLAPIYGLSVLNANYADGTTSWIWDATLTNHEMDIPEINAGGVRHSEIVVYE